MGRVARPLVKHSALLAAVALYVVIVGQNWGWFAGALMLAAIVMDRRRARG